MGLKRLYERCCEMHREPINLFLHLVAAIVLIYSLWINSLEGILIGILIGVIGHIFEEVKKKQKTKVTKAREKPVRRKRRKGALEMSIGTIVIMVIAVTMLILGIVFVRSVMCAGIQMTEDISAGTHQEIIKLFGADSYGVKCLGEGSQEIAFGSGGRRNLVCIVKSDENAQYKIDVKKIENLDRKDDTSFEAWVRDKGWGPGSVPPGGDGIEAVVVVLDIPNEVPKTTLKFTIESTDMQTNVNRTHYSYIDIEPVGLLTDAMC